jgi:hypothetical protein
VGACDREWIHKHKVYAGNISILLSTITKNQTNNVLDGIQVIFLFIAEIQLCSWCDTLVHQATQQVHFSLFLHASSIQTNSTRKGDTGRW